MFAYCNNNSIINVDREGCRPEAVVNIDDYGETQYYIYTYTYTKGRWFWKKYHTGRVYIYRNVGEDYFNEPSNIPSDFNASSDLMVADLTERDNATMYAYRADRVDKEYRDDIVRCLLKYDSDFDTRWNRTQKSLLVEWREHHRYAPFSDTARNIDFDNEEEGKGSIYYAKKAWDRFWN